MILFLFMNRYRLTLLFLFSIWSFMFLHAEPFFTGEEKLYSSRTGKLITTLNFSVEVNPSERSENYLLTIGNKAGITGEDGAKLSLWIFNKKMDAKTFANKNSNIDVNDIHLFDPFSSNRNVKFSISNARKIENIAVIPFDVNAGPGDKVELICSIYIASQKKKKTIIEDEAQVKISFDLPYQIVRESGRGGEVVTLEIDKDLNPVAELTPEELEEEKQMREDSIMQAKIQQLDFFISEKNKEIDELYVVIDSLVQGKVYDKTKIDSLENLVNILKKKVDLQEMGNVSLFPNDEVLVNKFTEFSSRYSEIIRKIEELKTPPAKKNWLMIIGVASMIVMFASMLILQIWNQVKSKRQQRKMKKEMEEANKKAKLDSLNSGDLGKI